MHAEAAAADEYLPAPQFEHEASPVSGLNLPAGQASQMPPFGPVYPWLQIQSAASLLAQAELELAGHVKHVAVDVAPTLSEYVPTPQSLHVASPLSPLYFPATHRAHMLPSGPEEPALQVQAVNVVLPCGELEFSGQNKHELGKLAASSDEYVPV